MPPTVPPTVAPIVSPRGRSTRRQLLAGAAGLFGAALATRTVAGLVSPGGGVLDAAELPELTGAAEVEVAAARLGAPPAAIAVPPAGKIAFPIDPSVDSYVLDNYGDCRGGGSRAHIGVDIISERGADVYAVEPGRIVRVFEDTGTAGWGWAIRTDDDVTYRYFHLDSLAEDLERGDTVDFGQVIGWVGSSGNYMYDDDGEQIEDRDNIHLHFECWPERTTTMDPLPLLHLPDGVDVGPPLKACLSRA